LPLGAFLVLHLALAASALWGTRAFVAADDWVAGVPGVWVAEAALVYAPLVVHGVIGAWLAARRVSVSSPAVTPPALATAMRWTGFAIAVFLVLHVVELRSRAARLGGLDGAGTATVLAGDLSSTWHGVPIWGLIYLGGTACVAVHLAVGLWGAFAASRRGRASAPARRAAAWAAVAFALGTWATFADVTLVHATGRGLAASDAADPIEPCGP
jgi:succinate dehydrogenase / fumarate reductase cytochrome b subunit